MNLYTMYFDRNTGSINGALTVQTVDPLTRKPIKVFDRFLARSGQWGYTNTSWTRGKSPIPFGEYKLHLNQVLQPGQKPGHSGIGEFRYISNTNNPRLIQSKDGKYERWDIGLHPENGYPGSAGCIVPVYYSTFLSLSRFLYDYSKYYDWMKLIVL